MRPVVPWSVKGIEPEARETAKQAARRAGMTLGAWLNHVILDQGADDATSTNSSSANFGGFEGAAGQPLPNGQSQAYGQPAAYGAPQIQPPIDLSPVTDAVRDLVRRIDANERNLEGSLEALANRVETSEQLFASGAQPADAQLERKMQQLNERLEASERDRLPFGRRPDDRIAFQGVEKTLNAVVDHLETADNQSEQKFHEIRQLLSEISERVDSSDAATRAQQEQAKTDAFGNTLQNLSERMAEMEQSVHSVAAGADQSRRQAVEEAVQAVSSKLDSDQQRSHVAGLQNTIETLAIRIENSETQSAHSIKALEDSFSGFITRLEKSQVNAADILPQVMSQLDGRLVEVVSRVTDTETRALETASSVEQALSTLAQSVSTAETRNADARETVQSMVAHVSERMERLEAGAGLPLSPTIAVGAGLAGMAPPPVSSAPPPPPGPLDGPADGLDAMLRAPEPAAPPAPASPADAPSLGDLPPPPPAAAPGSPPLASSPDAAPMAPPVLNEKKAARDFIAAARRAAQMSQPSREASPGLGFGEPSTRYAAFEEQEDNRGKRLAILIGGAVAALVVVLALVNWLAAPSTSSDTSDNLVSDDIFIDDIGAEGPLVDDTLVAQLDATVPLPGETATPFPVIPEAIPEDAGATDAANVPVSTPSAAVPERPAPTPLPEPRVAATAAPRSIVPNTSDMPPVEAAPTTPVTRAPATRTTRNALRSAAASGNSAAQYEVGLRYAQGTGVPQDYDQAAYWFDLSAKQNLAIAQYRLATLFEKGRGVPQDQEQARTWYEAAAQAGNVKAMHNLAVIYAEGKGVPQDFAKAGQWFLAAADHGLPDSQYNVAVLLERGLGLQEDLPAAYKWFTIAANNGDEGAGARRDAIADQLEATALVDAKLAAQTWGPRAADPIANGNLSSLGNWGTQSLSNSSSPRVAESDPRVAQAQGLLRELGYQPGPADGLMGPRTRDAIRDFQSKAGLQVSGSVDKKLLDTLKAYVR